MLTFLVLILALPALFIGSAFLFCPPGTCRFRILEDGDRETAARFLWAGFRNKVL